MREKNNHTLYGTSKITARRKFYLGCEKIVDHVINFHHDFAHGKSVSARGGYLLSAAPKRR
jgi:hypothetical protein